MICKNLITFCRVRDLHDAALAHTCYAGWDLSGEVLAQRLITEIIIGSTVEYLNDLSVDGPHQ